MITRIIAKMGKNMEIIDIIMAVPVSKVETTGFAKPPVVAVEANRVVMEAPDMAAAVPPPAIIAKAHVTTGLKSETVESMTIVPAKVAKGIEIPSKILSIYGIK